jgi:hypothetical protein
MKVDKVSKIKTHIICDIPVFMVGHDRPVDIIKDVTLRFRKHHERTKTEYNLIRKSIDIQIENLARRERIGNILTNWVAGGCKVNDINATYENVIIDGYTFNMVKTIMVADRNYLSNVRDKKLEKILNED